MIAQLERGISKDGVRASSDVATQIARIESSDKGRVSVNHTVALVLVAVLAAVGIDHLG